MNRERRLAGELSATAAALRDCRRRIDALERLAARLAAECEGNNEAGAAAAQAQGDCRIVEDDGEAD
jgi:hypothetical protein